MKPKVYVQLPKAGLGNKLLTWSRGYVFSKLNHLEFYNSSWTNIHLGAWFRRERKKRLYIAYFTENKFIKKVFFFCLKLVAKKVYEPSVRKEECLPDNTVFVFNKIFTDYDFFKEIRPHRKMVRDGIFKTLRPPLQQQLDKYERPEIGLHVRRGDFKIGSTLTPVSFFIEVVNGIRAALGENTPVTVFTDAYPEEIQSLLQLNNVKVAEEKPDILDILLLASSKILVLSIGSSFSYWAAFLSEGVIIKHSKEWHAPFRSEDDPLFSQENFWNGNLLKHRGTI